MTSLLAELIETGKAEGVGLGVELGRAEGERATLGRLLIVRFADLPSGVHERLRRVTDLAKLDELADFAMTCENLNDFLAQLPPVTDPSD